MYRMLAAVHVSDSLNSDGSCQGNSLPATLFAKVSERMYTDRFSLTPKTFEYVQYVVNTSGVAAGRSQILIHLMTDCLLSLFDCSENPIATDNMLAEAFTIHVCNNSMAHSIFSTVLLSLVTV